MLVEQTCDDLLEIADKKIDAIERETERLIRETKGIIEENVEDPESRPFLTGQNSAQTMRLQTKN